MFDAPYEAIFLLPEPLCKSCGTKIPPSDSGTESSPCPKCGEIFHWSLREKFATTIILAYVAGESAKEEAKRILEDFKSRRWCKKHGFQKVLPLEHPPGKIREYCTHCLACAMTRSIRCGKDYPSNTEAVQHKAYELWVKGGCREGVAAQNWIEAEQFVLSTECSKAENK